MTVFIFDSASNPILVVEGVCPFFCNVQIHTKTKISLLAGVFTQTSQPSLKYNDSNLSSGGRLGCIHPTQKFPPLLWKPRVAREKRLKTWMTWQWCFSARVLTINFDPHALIHFVSHILHVLTSVPQQQQIVTFDRGMLLHHPSGIRLCRYGGSVWDKFYTYLWHEWSQMISNDPSDHFAGWGWSKWSNTSSKGSSLRWRFRCFLELCLHFPEKCVNCECSIS